MVENLHSVLCGWLDGDGTHRYPLRVFYEDTDAGGVVYHANYLLFMERARTALLGLLGISQAALVADSGVAFAVRRCEIDYLAPARLDDTLEVETHMVDMGGASFAFAQQIRHANRSNDGPGDSPGEGPGQEAGRAGGLLARARVRIAVLSRAGRPTRLPAAVRDVLTSHFQRQRRVEGIWSTH